jgi:predicted AAA+ superfamily ATPase
VYLEIVEHYLKKEGFELSAEAREEALRWTVVRASRSGRIAKQFADDYVGRARLKGTG